MANAKISNDSIFVPKTNITDVDGLAGFKGSGNVKISGANLINSLESNMSLSNISGTLSVTKGGTGQTSYTDGQLLIGNTTGNTLAKATLTAGTGVTITNGNGSITVANSAPDQTVALTGGTGISTSGTYPNFTITNSAPNQATPAAGSSGQLQYNNGSNGFTATSDMVYTTDQLKVQNTLYLDGNGTNAGIVKLGCEAAGASHYVGLEGPTHEGANSYIIKFPDADPEVGKILKVSSFSSDKAIMEWANDTDTDTSIYNVNGSLTGARTVTMGGNNLTFASSGGLFTIQKNLKVEGQSYGDITSVSNATVDWDNGNIQSITLPSGASTYTPTNPQAGATYILKIIQPSAGDGTITWGSSVKWPGATAPTLTASNAAVDVVTLIYDGTNYLATSVLNLS